MADKIELHEHPEYKAQEPDFRLFQDLYDGKHAVLTQEKYLWPHELERKAGNKLREIRTTRSRYTQLFEPTESTWVNICTSDKMDIPEEVKRLFGDYINDVDGEGHSIETFLRERLAPHYFRFGKVFGLTDSPKGSAKSEAERVSQGLRPYWTMLNPLDVKDWQVFTSGKYAKKLKAIRTDFIVNVARESLTTKPEQLRESSIRSIVNNQYVVDTYRCKTDQQAGQDWKKEDSQSVAGHEELPVAHICSEPWLKDVAQICLSVFNLESALDSALNAQAFQRIFIAGENSDGTKLAVSEHGVIFLADGSTVTAVNPFDSTPLSSRIDQKIRFLYKTAFNKAHALPEDSKETQSTDAQQKAQEETLALANAAIDDLENVLNEMIRHWAKFMKQDNFTARVKLGRNITVESVQEQIQIFQAYGDAIRKVPSWYKAHLQRVAERDNLANIKEVKDDIEKLDLDAMNQEKVQQERKRLLGQVANGGQGKGVVQGEAKGERQEATSPG